MNTYMRTYFCKGVLYDTLPTAVWIFVNGYTQPYTVIYHGKFRVAILLYRCASWIIINITRFPFFSSRFKRSFTFTRTNVDFILLHVTFNWKWIFKILVKKTQYKHRFFNIYLFNISCIIFGIHIRGLYSSASLQVIYCITII